MEKRLENLLKNEKQIYKYKATDGNFYNVRLEDTHENNSRGGKIIIRYISKKPAGFGEGQDGEGPYKRFQLESEMERGELIPQSSKGGKRKTRKAKKTRKHKKGTRKH